MMSLETRQSERQRLAARALELTAQRGQEVTLILLAADEGISRHRLEQLFEDDGDLFEAVAELWMEPHVAIMEEVIASDLPPNRKMYEFFVRRFRVTRQRYRQDPAAFALICELGAARFERVRSFVDLADHYLCEVIAQAQAHGPLGIITFEPHPREYFAPSAPTFRLMNAEARANRLARLGVEHLFQPFVGSFLVVTQYAKQFFGVDKGRQD